MPDPISSLRIRSERNQPDTHRRRGPAGVGFYGDPARGHGPESSSCRRAPTTSTAALLEGNGMDVHSAMIAVEKADLSFQLMMQVRNKIVSAYQEISRMQF